jgi:hypothetical protein
LDKQPLFASGHVSLQITSFSEQKRCRTCTYHSVLHTYLLTIDVLDMDAQTGKGLGDFVRSRRDCLCGENFVESGVNQMSAQCSPRAATVASKIRTGNSTCSPVLSSPAPGSRRPVNVS